VFRILEDPLDFQFAKTSLNRLWVSVVAVLSLQLQQVQEVQQQERL
jgi:hypothetical protein